MAAHDEKPEKIEIDPSALTPQQAQLLHRFFLEQEKKNKKDRSKEKLFDIDIAYPFEGKVIYFKTPIFRRKKMYEDFHVCDSAETLPARENREKNKLYIVKNADGGVDVYSLDHDEHVHLTRNQVLTLQREKNIYFANGNPVNHQKMSALMHECGYPINRYIYQVIGDYVAEGNFGAFYESPGKLEHSNGSMTYIDYAKDLHMRNGEMVARLPKGIKEQLVEKSSYYRGLTAIMREGLFWKMLDEAKSAMHSQTKKIVRIKDKILNQKPIGKTLMLQRFYPGVTLEEMLLHPEKHPLTIHERYQLTIKLLEELKKFHLSKLIHRDLKPENIKIYRNNNEFNIHIIDVGLAEEEGSHAAVAGTPNFIPYEWFALEERQVSKVSKQDDFFAMGVVLKLLWKDHILISRYNNLFEQMGRDEISGEELYAFFAAKYYFNLPSDVQISPKLTQQMQMQSISLPTLEMVIEGLTQNRPEKRLSGDAALELLKGSQENKIDLEDKKTELAAEDDIKKGFREIEKLSRDMRLIFFTEWIAIKAKQSAEWKNFSQFCYNNSMLIRSKDIPELLRVTMQFPTAKKEKQEQHAKIAMILRGSPLTRAWEQTFLPHRTAAERDNVTFSDYFLGWPEKNGTAAKVIYWCTLGFVMTPIKNIIKFSTEFPLKLLAESLDYLNYKIDHTNPKTTAGQVARVVGTWIFPGIFNVIAIGAHLLVRSVTSPITSIRAANALKDPAERVVCVTLSAICSCAAFAALTVLALPVIPVVGSWALGQAAGLGLPAIPAFLSNIVAMVFPAFLVNGAREQLTQSMGHSSVKQSLPVKANQVAPAPSHSSFKTMIRKLTGSAGPLPKNSAAANHEVKNGSTISTSLPPEQSQTVVFKAPDSIEEKVVPTQSSSKSR